MRGSGVLQPPPTAVASLFFNRTPSLPLSSLPFNSSSNIGCRSRGNRRTLAPLFVHKEENSSTSISTSIPTTQEKIEEGDDVDPQDLEYVLERLKKNRDMLFNEVKLTLMIEDPRDVERRRLLGIDDEDAPTRDDLADALVQVNEGKIPENRVALKMLAEEMIQWPNLEVEITKKKPAGKSLYARFTNTGVDPQVAAKRLNIDWDSAAEIEDVQTDDVEVPPLLGYGALYLITALPVIIGISVVLILFYNSLQ
ncbi:hypothetical protein RD792_003705 [Penstemon davidsonii]|uniref:Ycf3-interacting protein 1, chloroplastic n=1 Tax=Penstemon davidsonii TaxID=160366 RepID=A0ABR0DFK5_9LAMI|nr:hypothetical protein RD792_003705 [Penstemon davidsonii]